METIRSEYRKALSVDTRLLTYVKQVILCSDILIYQDLNYINVYWTPIVSCDKKLKEIQRLGELSLSALAIGRVVNSSAVMVGGPLLCTSAMAIHKMWVNRQLRWRTNKVADWISLMQDLIKTVSFIKDYVNKKTFFCNQVCLTKIVTPQTYYFEMGKTQYRLMYEYCKLMNTALRDLHIMLNATLDEHLRYHFEEFQYDKYKDRVPNLEDCLDDYKKLYSACRILHSKTLAAFLMGLLYNIDKPMLNTIFDQWFCPLLNEAQRIVSSLSKELDDFRFVMHTVPEVSHPEPQERVFGANKIFAEYYFLLHQQFEALNKLRRANCTDKKSEMPDIFKDLRANNLAGIDLVTFLVRGFIKMKSRSAVTSKPTTSYDRSHGDYSPDQNEAGPSGMAPRATNSEPQVGETEDGIEFMKDLYDNLDKRAETQEGAAEQNDVTPEIGASPVSIQMRPSTSEMSPTPTVMSPTFNSRMSNVTPPFMIFEMDDVDVPNRGISDSIALAAAQPNASEESIPIDNEEE